MHDKIYARVIDGEVKEYPVTCQIIKNRAHPLSWYKECAYYPKPIIEEFQYLKENLLYIEADDRIFVTYEICDMDIQTVLNIIHMRDNLNILSPENSQPITVADLTQERIKKISDLATEYVQNKLDQFAQTRNYDSILSATTYTGSLVPQFKAEADKAIQLRDSTWAGLYVYMNKILSLELPIPRTTKDIDDNLPVLSWD